jgi:large subunit ribosomal protein L4
MESKVYNQEGKESGKIMLPEAIFGARWNPELIQQVVVGMQANARTSVAHTKNRGEVRGGGKKPWQQKGLGRARHGSIRSPIWRGGGVTFGPRNEKDFSKKINKKMRTQALYSVLSKKLSDGEILFVDSLTFEQPKSAQARSTIDALHTIKGYEELKTKKHNAALIALPGQDANVEKSFNNFGNVKVGMARNLNPVDALKYKWVIIVAPEVSTKQLQERSEKKVKEEEK